MLKLRKSVAVVSALAICFVSMGSKVSRAEDNNKKDWNYYLNLSDEEVYDEYKAYRESIGSPIGERVVEYGLIQYDYLKHLSMSIAYDSVEANQFVCKIEKVEDESLLKNLDDYSAEQFGFVNDNGNYVQALYDDINKSSSYDALVRITSVDSKMNASTNYDILRRSLTISNSEFAKAFNCKIVVEPIFIDGSDMILGDANCNGKVEISDAVAILQYLANSEKYPLMKEGYEAADFDGDGITGADALTIQKMDAAMGGNSVFWKENPVISRVGNSSAPNASKVCVNADKLEDKTEVHAPVFISKTAEEFDSLVDFISGEYNTQSVLNEGYYKFADAVDIYKGNEVFFKDNFLIVVNIDAGSSTIKHTLNRVENSDNGEIKVYIDRTSPMSVAADMVEYFMFVECSKSALNDNSTFDAVLSEIKKGS